MDNSHEHTNPVTFVISEVVDPNQIEAYEAWSRGINQAARQFDGFLGVDIIRPRDHAYPEYVVILKFDNYTHFRNWQISPIYQEWLEKAQALVVSRTRQHQLNGLELWFTLPPNILQASAQPAYYKKVFLGILAVYPLILLANALLNPFLQNLPPLLSLLVSVTFVSALLTYPVMPWLTKALGFWLYPTLGRYRNTNSYHKTVR